MGLDLLGWRRGKNGSPEVFQQLLQWDSLSVRHQDRQAMLSKCGLGILTFLVHTGALKAVTHSGFPQHICTKCHHLQLKWLFPIKRKKHNFWKNNLLSKCDFLASTYFFILLQKGIGFDFFCVLFRYSISLLSEAQKSWGVSRLTLRCLPSGTHSPQSQCCSPQCSLWVMPGNRSCSMLWPEGNFVAKRESGTDVCNFLHSFSKSFCACFECSIVFWWNLLKRGFTNIGQLNQCWLAVNLN